ncbi:hypothetical protein OAQ71_00130, partial [bacterium]|nr:hypothetical protein [bacterium]
ALGLLGGGFSADGRFRGAFQNASHSGRLMCLATISAVFCVIESKRGRVIAMAVLFLAMPMLIISQTRASIAATGIGLLVLMVAGLRTRKVGYRLGLALLVTIPTVSAPWWLAEENLSQATGFLRLEGGVDGVLAARSANWRGIDSFMDYGVVGSGYMSKFGAATGAREVFGVRFPTYDWQTASDPLNMWHTAGQSMGVPAVFALVCLLASLCVTASRCDASLRAFFFAVLAAHLLFGTVDGNWLTSFGNETDRLSAFILGATLFARSR